MPEAKTTLGGNMFRVADNIKKGLKVLVYYDDLRSSTVAQRLMVGPVKTVMHIGLNKRREIYFPFSN
jgi:hypothetical protein